MSKNHKKEVTSLLKKYTTHDFITLTSRGNEAIFAALYCARKLNKNKTVLIPDQGGWLTYPKYPKMLGMNVRLVKTNYGLLNLLDLKTKIRNANCLLYQNPAGYFANQEIKKIYEICKNKAFVILDASGSLGDEELCNGQFADFIVGSFRKWKVADIGYGGFLSAKNKKSFEEPKEIFNTIEFDDTYSKDLYGTLKDIRKRLKFLYAKCDTIKKDLKSLDIIHKNKKGITVVVKFNNKNEFQRIKNYCIENNLAFTLCPRYIRVNENAISIEVKRLR